MTFAEQEGELMHKSDYSSTHGFNDWNSAETVRRFWAFRLRSNAQEAQDERPHLTEIDHTEEDVDRILGVIDRALSAFVDLNSGSSAVVVGGVDVDPGDAAEAGLEVSSKQQHLNYLMATPLSFLASPGSGREERPWSTALSQAVAPVAEPDALDVVGASASPRVVFKGLTDHESNLSKAFLTIAKSRGVKIDQVELRTTDLARVVQIQGSLVATDTANPVSCLFANRALREAFDAPRAKGELVADPTSQMLPPAQRVAIRCSFKEALGPSLSKILGYVERNDFVVRDASGRGLSTGEQEQSEVSLEVVSRSAVDELKSKFYGFMEENLEGFVAQEFLLEEASSLKTP